MNSYEMEFNPPIENRETDELILISKNSNDDYQARAIELAKKELTRRRISQNQIDRRFEELSQEEEKIVHQKLSEMAAEDYSLFEKLLIIIFWPKEILRDWYLRKEGYATKASNRIKLILIGIALYLILILTSK